MLSFELYQFIERIKKLNAVGCLRVPESDLENLKLLLNQASQLVSLESEAEKVKLYYLNPSQTIPKNPSKPCLFIVTHESFQKEEERPWREELYRCVDYYFSVT